MASARSLNTPHDHLILDGIRSIYQQDKLTDVTLTSKYAGQEHSVECHKLVLAAVSEFFRKKFISADRCEEVNIVHLENISPEVLKAAVTYVYEGKCTINSEVCKGLLSVGDSWKLESLKNECFQFMIREMKEGNVIQLYEMALRYNAKQTVLSVFIKLIRKNFKSFHDNNSLQMLSVSSLKKVLSLLDEATQINASTAYDAIMQWYTAHPDNDITGLLDLVRFDQMPHDELVRILPNLALGGYMTQTAKVQDILKQALKAKPTEPQPSNTDPVHVPASVPSTSSVQQYVPTSVLTGSSAHQIQSYPVPKVQLSRHMKLQRYMYEREKCKEKKT